MLIHIHSPCLMHITQGKVYIPTTTPSVIIPGPISPASTIHSSPKGGRTARRFGTGALVVGAKTPNPTAYCRSTVTPSETPQLGRKPVTASISGMFLLSGVAHCGLWSSSCTIQSPKEEWIGSSFRPHRATASVRPSPNEWTTTSVKHGILWVDGEMITFRR